jgi:ParB/RepB/Spo0J family partition protein
MKKNKSGQVVELALTALRPGHNDRKRFKAEPLLELARSVAEFGLAQPITVRPAADGKYEIVAGERRWRAHKIYTDKVKAGEWAESDKCRPGYIQAIVRELNNEEASGIMLAENIHREDLDPIEEAQAYQRRIDEHDWTVARIAQAAKVSAERVNNRLKLLKLEPALQEMVSNGHLKTHFAEEMSALDFNRQRLVVAWLNEQNYIPARKHVAQYVGKLLAEQAQESLFAGFFNPKAVEVAESDEARVSDMLMPLAGLPALPVTQGNVGEMIDAYLAELMTGGFKAEAAVVMDLWRKLMKCNRAQVKPWDSKVLALL